MKNSNTTNPMNQIAVPGTTMCARPALTGGSGGGEPVPPAGCDGGGFTTITLVGGTVRRVPLAGAGACGRRSLAAVQDEVRCGR